MYRSSINKLTVSVCTSQAVWRVTEKFKSVSSGYIVLGVAFFFFKIFGGACCQICVEKLTSSSGSYGVGVGTFFVIEIVSGKIARQGCLTCV